MADKVSVIIPTYNYGRFIAEAVESALGQTVAPGEVVVVDDGSTDDTADIVAGFAGRVRYVKQENQGVSAARNRGALATISEYIAFMDADDKWEPTKLEKQLSVFASDPEIGLVHCGMREFDSATGKTLTTDLDGGEGWMAESLLLWNGSTIIGPGGTILLKREAFDRAGGFDEAMKVGEDWDLCYRIARLYKVGFVREPLVNYRSHGANAHRNVAEMESGMTRFYEKAFAEGDADVLKLRPRAYGNFHRVLSGSYFRSGSYGEFLKHAVKSIWYRPANFAYFASFPLRQLRNLPPRDRS